MIREALPPGPMCQHICARGEGVPCSNKAIYVCSHCNKLLCPQHMHYRADSLSPWPRNGDMVCEDCKGTAHAW